MDKWTALVLVCVSAIPTTSSDLSGALPRRNLTWTDILKRDLLHTQHYDKYARPAQHTNTTTVNLGMDIKHVKLDELQHIMTVQAWVRMTWIDEKLKWNVTQYQGVDILRLMSHELWQPDIVLYNSATGNMMDSYGNANCLAYPNGEILWVPPAEFKVFCHLDLRLWPYDSHSCNLTLGSWTYDGDKLDLQKHEVDSGLDLMEVNHEWEVLGLDVVRNEKVFACCPEPYPDLRFTVKLKRRSPMYEALVISPITVIVLITLATFWLPPGAGEKILLNVSTLIMITIFLMYFAHKLPAMGDHTPLVMLFYTRCFYMVCGGTILSVIVVILARTKQTTRLPWTVKDALTGWPGRILGLEFITQATSLHEEPSHADLRDHTSVFQDHDHMGNHCDSSRMSKASNQHDWLLLASAVDRMAFLIYCFFFSVMAIVYAV